MSVNLIEELSDDVASLTLYRPGRLNAMTKPMMSKMHEVPDMMCCFLKQPYNRAAQSFFHKVSLGISG